MDDKIIATFCLCDDLLKAMQHQEDHQCQMNDAEVMTTACIASLCFRGNQASARAMLQQHGYILGRPNRPLAIDRLLDSSCQCRFSSIRWPQYSQGDKGCPGTPAAAHIDFHHPLI
jgi:hypothetical protein